VPGEPIADGSVWQSADDRGHLPHDGVGHDAGDVVQEAHALADP
jgi:hypothetical protein